jgi:ribosomal protein S18 acetylase RimI-like enzyme
MIFTKLHSQDIANLKQIYASYCSSFPEDERRNEEQFYALLENRKARLLAIDIQNNRIGYLITWDLDKAVFLEHFEVFEVYRNNKYGSKILTEFAKIHPHLILESEPSTLNEIAARRIAFYERNGYKIVDENYIQPAYGEGKNPLNLCLMSNFTPTDLSATIKNIHQTVYGK